ncbi:VOC family protein, partial [Chamaesiphon sp. OTE_75_metabat_556]|uniref:VOC family protein n=1 Tax=Chamaesiphon sp. OTE_75_metabat_556 TaxID=2964692 RepID=UPI00286A4157
MTAVKSIGMTVADMDRSIDFYTTVLTFTKIADRRITGLEAIDKLSLQTEQIQEMATIHLRVVVLQLGAETLDLTEFLTDKGRSIPLNSRSNDVWFQHLAIVVSNMHRAYQHVRQHAIVQISPQPQTLPDWNPVAGGIEAFYCQDPDGHNLELIHFPPDKGDPKWQQPTTDLFLGIDHTAIVVTDTAASRVFYCDLLGLKLQQESENFGLEQAQLSGVAHPKVKITSLKASAGIGIELLEYLEPNDGRAIPTDTEANDGWCSQTTIVVADAIETVQQLRNARLPIFSDVVSPGTNSLEVDRQFLICDPDGHKIR